MTEGGIDSRPSAQYAQGVATGAWVADPAQQAALAELDRIHDRLLAAQVVRSGALGRLLARLHRSPPVRGLYLWGAVGRGKTFLTELLFEHIRLTAKRRLHFHRFMAQVQARLRDLHGVRDPLRVVAADLARQARLLVLDECIVTDIGDAMLLGHLLECLFDQGVTLVVTSNIAPSDLYKDGLQRSQFLPAIAAIERHCAVLQLDGAQDYRLTHLRNTTTWIVPADEEAEARLQGSFETLATGLPRLPETLHVNDRPIAVRAHADGIVWFDFDQLCLGPRAVADYIEIAKDFHTVLLSGVPVFARADEDAAKRFVLLIDELYDRHVNLIASAAAAPADLYHGHRHGAEFARTQSRLLDMQSGDYLALEHRP
ncbi:MAG: AFG1 family ATPase [Proteobacteria bacterium]|nr:AFG1 family ATPase [Pseudomonadota bacterium]MBS0464175.1 AFG1 family ATPase [Pseudomonadota bacterium]